MAVLSSAWTAEAHTQRDGRRWVREVHILDDGSAPIVFDYLSADIDDRDAIAAERAARINAMEPDEMLALTRMLGGG